MEQHLYIMNRQHLNLYFSPQYITRSISTWNYLPTFAAGTCFGHESLLISYNRKPPPRFTNNKYYHNILVLTRAAGSFSFAPCFFAPCRSGKGRTPLGDFQHPDVLQGAIFIPQPSNLQPLTKSTEASPWQQPKQF